MPKVSKWLAYRITKVQTSEGTRHIVSASGVEIERFRTRFGAKRYIRRTERGIARHYRKERKRRQEESGIG